MSSLIFPYTPFLDGVFANLRSDKIDVSRYPIDHICYRVATLLEYTRMQREFGSIGELLAETLIGGRQISTYRLYEPLRYRDYDIRLVELPSPKEGSPYPTGWEHAEFVIGRDPHSLLEIYPSIDWHTGALAKEINPDISRKYSDGTSVKFHELPLDEIIRREQEMEG